MARRTRNDKENAAPPEGESREGESFETLLGEAEAVADRLERGDVPLDEALSLYEQGVNRLRRSAALLTRAEERVKQLALAPDQTFHLVDFEDGDGDGPDADDGEDGEDDA